MAKTPEEIPAGQEGLGDLEELTDVSTEDIQAEEDLESTQDGYSEADRREERIEMDNDAVDTLVDEAQEVSDEGIDSDGYDRG